MPKDTGPSLSGDQYDGGGVSKDDLLAGEQYMSNRENKANKEIQDVADGKTFGGGSGILSSSAGKAVRGLFGGK
jgi:hypothetical protein